MANGNGPSALGVVTGAAVGAGTMGVALSRTRLAPGWKAAFTAAANGVAAGVAALVGAPGVALGFVAAGVVQGGAYAAQQLALARYIGAPDSKAALPGGTTAAATIAGAVNAAANTTSTAITAATGT